MDVTVDRKGFFRGLETHMFSSSSKLQMAISLALEPAANLVSEGDQRTVVAARLNLRMTRVGVQPDGEGSQA